MLRLKLISFQAWVFSATGNMLGITIANPNGIHLAWLEWDELLIQGENTIASWCAIQEVSQRPGEQLQKILMMYRSYPKFHFPFGPDEYNRQFHIILSVPPFLCPCALRVKRVFFWLFILLLDHYLIGLVLLVLVSSPSLVWSFRIVCRISCYVFFLKGLACIDIVSLIANLLSLTLSIWSSHPAIFRLVIQVWIWDGIATSCLYLLSVRFCCWNRDYWPDRSSFRHWTGCY